MPSSTKNKSTIGSIDSVADTLFPDVAVGAIAP